jgi:hypothetical protein
MSSILKKLMAFAILIIAAGHLEAQIPGRAPVKKINPVITRPTEIHSYNWYKADILKRYPQLSTQATKHAPLSGMRTMQGFPTYAQRRQNLLQRYPQLQQQATIAAPSRTLSAGDKMQPAQRSAYYRALVQKQIEMARMQAEQIRKNVQKKTPIVPAANH